MSTIQYDSHTADKFVVRLPEGLRGQIEAAANTSDRSMNGIIVQAVKQYLDAQNRQELLLTALANAASSNTESVEMLKPQIDPRDLFIELNPTGASETELEMGNSGFVDGRTHADYLIFLAGYREAEAGQAQLSQDERIPL